MSTLPKIKEYAIKYLSETKKMKPEEIASELKIDINIITKLISNKITSVAKTDKTKDLMIRQTSAKKQNTVSIMTESAAQLNDEFVKSMNSGSIDTTRYIFKPKG